MALDSRCGNQAKTRPTLLPQEVLYEEFRDARGTANRCRRAGFMLRAVAGSDRPVPRWIERATKGGQILGCRRQRRVERAGDEPGREATGGCGPPVRLPVDGAVPRGGSGA